MLTQVGEIYYYSKSDPRSEVLTGIIIYRLEKGKRIGSGRNKIPWPCKFCAAHSQVYLAGGAFHFFNNPSKLLEKGGVGNSWFVWRRNLTASQPASQPVSQLVRQGEKSSKDITYSWFDPPTSTTTPQQPDQRCFLIHHKNNSIDPFCEHLDEIESETEKNMYK